MKIRILILLTILIIVQSSVLSQEIFKGIEVVELDCRKQGSITLVDHTATNQQNFIIEKRIFSEGICKDIKYKIRMAQLETDINYDLFPKGHVLLEYKGFIHKLGPNQYSYNGILTISQDIITLNSSKKSFAVTWVRDFSGVTYNGIDANNTLKDEILSACDDFLKDYFEAN